jgi:hypothetical protein
MKMKKMIFGLLSLLLLTTGMKAQVVIGTKAAEVESSAVLDLNSGIDGNLGLLLPRVPLTSETDAVTIPSPAIGLMVYADGIGGLAAGVYAWDGSKWQTNESNSSVTVPDPVNSFDLVPPNQDVVRWQTGTTIAAGNFNGGAAATLPFVSWNVISGADNIRDVTTTLNTFAFKAAKKGPTVVRATSLDGHTSEEATINVTYAPVENITVTAPGYSEYIWTGATQPLTAAVTPEDATRPNVTWDASLGTITSDGDFSLAAITAPATEELVTITAAAQDDSGKSGEKEINVRQAVTGITISTTSPSTVPNSTTTAEVSVSQVLPSNPYDPSISWSCTNCTVSGSGTDVTVNLGVGANLITARWIHDNYVVSNALTITRASGEPSFTCEGVPDEVLNLPHYYLTVGTLVVAGTLPWDSDTAVMGASEVSYKWQSTNWSQRTNYGFNTQYGKLYNLYKICK